MRSGPLIVLVNRQTQIRRRAAILRNVAIPHLPVRILIVSKRQIGPQHAFLAAQVLRFRNRATLSPAKTHRI